MPSNVRDLRVCFVGDSFMAGVGDSAGLGWVGRVSTRLQADGFGLTSYNLGVRRETSTMIAARLAREVRPRLSVAEDAGIVVCFGANDTVLENGTQRTSTDETLEALRKIRRETKPTRLLLLGPPAVSDDRQNERIAALHQPLREEAARLGVPFIDCFTDTSRDDVWLRELGAGDGYHPDAAGYEVLASIVYGSLREWLSIREPVARVVGGHRSD